MPLKQLASPLIVIIVGVILTIMVFAAPDSNTGARPPQQDDYPATQTAQALGNNQDPYASPGSATSTATATTTTTSGPTSASPSATQSTPTGTTVQPTEPIDTSPSPTTVTPTEIETPPEPEILATPTPVRTLICVPGEPIEITGQGPPRAAFLLYFGRRPVSGGSVSPDGTFSITLVVGRERPGSHLVAVRVRGTDEVLRELTCEIPAPPTPTPMRGQPGAQRVGR